jgi:hypothetical protein
LQSQRGSKFEVVSAFGEGVEAEELEVHCLDGISCRLGEKRAASEGMGIWLSQKGEGFLQSFGAMVGNYHIKSPH